MPEQTDQTSPRDAGHTTTEHFWTKVLVILGTVVGVGGFLGEAIVRISGFLPAGSTALQIAGVVGIVVALLKTIAYDVSRTIVKLKIANADVEIAKLKSPTDAAATVLGEDAPENL